MIEEQLVGQIVIHKVFGEGIIRNVDQQHLEVYFSDKNRVSKFAYPSCFDGFLTLKNNSIQDELEEEVETWKRESGAIKKEELRHQYEKTLQGIEARRIAAEEKKLKAAQRLTEHRTSHNFVKRNKRD